MPKKVNNFYPINVTSGTCKESTFFIFASCEPLSVSNKLNGSQLAKMKKYIPHMSLT